MDQFLHWFPETPHKEYIAAIEVVFRSLKTTEAEELRADILGTPTLQNAT